MLHNKEQLVRRLTTQPLPRAVRWYDPGVLVRTGIRDILSSVFGEYADQRLMQAATDRFKDEKDLVSRYDYSKPREGADSASASAPFWVDYIADVGDGFGATYGMATLLAQDSLTLSNLPGETLPAGRILIMGGDQCYPLATPEEYQERLVLPYATAFPPLSRDERHKERLLFAIPGNHDWYDGLAAFDGLFCQNRDALPDRGRGRRIGGWRCPQHRSYWAIRLPHDWWLWGVDIQFSRYLDSAQESYFNAVVDQMEGGKDGEIRHHNIVLCIAEPHWLDAEFAGIDTVDSLHTIVRIAMRRTRGTNREPVKNREVRVRAVLAGDWHHFSHYHLESVSDPGDPKAKDDPSGRVRLQIPLICAGGGGAFLHSTTDLRKRIEVSWGVRPENLPAAQQTGAGSGEGKSAAPRRRRPERFTGTATLVTCYPSRKRSTLLSLRNLAFPLRNWKFSLILGAICWIVTWQFYAVAKKTWLASEMQRADFASVNSLSNKMLLGLPEVLKGSPFLLLFVAALWGGLAWYVTVSEKRTTFFGLLVRTVVGGLHALAHLKTMFLVLALGLAVGTEVNSHSAFSPVLYIPSAFYPVLYSAGAVVLGGLAGGFVFGAYWVLTGLLARMHTGDAFGALGIRNYKNFLRMRFDEDKLVIYPIAVDKLPSTKACSRVLKRKPPTPESSTLLELPRKLKPYLIPKWERRKGPEGKRLRRKRVVEPIVLPRIPRMAEPHPTAAADAAS